MPQILVVVESLSLCNLSLHDIRFTGACYELSDYIFIEASGPDTIRFFHGQLTSDIKALKINDGHYSGRLDKNGRLQYFFLVLRSSETSLTFCIHKNFSEKFLDEMDKFIIMDDVSLQLVDVVGVVATGLKQTLDFDNLETYDVPFYLESMKLVLLPPDKTWEDLLPLKGLDDLWFFSGVPKNIDVNFINESVLNEYAISYKKGCYLGQETANKIQSNRGGAKYPILLRVENFKQHSVSSFKVGNQLIKDKDVRGVYTLGEMSFLSFLSPRHLRVKGKNVKIEIDNIGYDAVVDYHPFFKTHEKISKASEFYEYAVANFQNDNFFLAENYMRAAIKLNPFEAEYYEALGVLLGRLERYEEAIELMESLGKIDPESVMAHTNKSFYLMRLGRIKEAEDEKAQATIKSFAMFGREAQSKKTLEENLQKERAETERKRQMFLDVLEIDPEDEIANFGLGDIAFRDKKFREAYEFFKKVLETNPKHSQTYLKMGQTLECLERINEARELYLKGIEVASKQGELMPANNMQERINLLKV